MKILASLTITGVQFCPSNLSKGETGMKQYTFVAALLIASFTSVSASQRIEVALES